MYPKEGPVTYIPTIYGFKIFGLKGSRFEIQYDHSGKTVNQKEVDAILNNKKKVPTDGRKMLISWINAVFNK